MKTNKFLIGTCITALLAACSTPKNTTQIMEKELTAVEVSKDIDSLSYSLGLSIGSNLKSQNLTEITYKSLSQGVQDAIEGNEKFTQEEANAIINEVFAAKQKEASKGNIEEGAKFLTENAKRKGVVSLPSGLQYEILKAGTGAKPTATSQVKTHYHGTLIDGTVFDSSVERNEPATFGVNQVIAGWTEALQLMPVGSKWKLFIPYNLAYGERGAGGAIKPFAALVFEVELLEIVKK